MAVVRVSYGRRIPVITRGQLRWRTQRTANMTTGKSRSHQWHPWVLVLCLSTFSLAQSDTDWNQVDRRQTLLGRLFVLDVDFSPNSQLLATGDQNGVITLHETVEGTELKRIQASAKRIESLAFSPDGQMLATASDDGTARIWDIPAGKELRRIAITNEGNGDLGIVQSVAFSPDGRQLASGNSSGWVQLWDVSSGKKVWQFEQSGAVKSLAFSPNSQRLLTAGSKACLWDAVSGQQVRCLTGHQSGVNSVAYSHDATMLATASDDGTARIWDSSSGLERQRFTGRNHVAFSPSDAVLATTAGDRTARLWEISSGRELRRWGSSGPNTFTDLAFSRDGTRLAIGGYPFFTAIYGTPDFIPVFK